MKKNKLFFAGLAIFTMLFGAGNVVFPLDLGRCVGDQVLYALFGLCLTGIVVPLVGLIATMLFDGDYKAFLYNAGVVPGASILFLIMLLFGPFGATPRCITLAHGAVQWHLPFLSLPIFTLIVAFLIYLATIKRGQLVDVLGRIIGPLKLVLLFSIIILGFVFPGVMQSSDYSSTQSFLRGLSEGYKTMDLLATILFSSFILVFLRKNTIQKSYTRNQLLMWGMQAALVGGVLLGLVYAGFCIVAAMYGSMIIDVERAQILSALTMIILGPQASILANATITLACLSTAMALTSVFAEYLSMQLFRDKLAYKYSLLLTICATLVMANLGFSGIEKLVDPVITMLYPVLIVLCVANIAYKLYGFSYVKAVTISAFVGVIASHLIH